MKTALIIAGLLLAVFLVNIGDEFATPDGQAESYATSQNYGMVYRRPAVATRDHALSYWAQDLAEGYAGPRVKDPNPYQSRTCDDVAATYPRPA